MTPDEERIAVHLASVLDPEVTTRIGSCTVTGTCRCGCSSISLTTTAPRGRPNRGHSAPHLSVSAIAQRAASDDVLVTLHLFDGLIGELELFDPLAGEGHGVDPADITAMAPPEVD